MNRKMPYLKIKITFLNLKLCYYSYMIQTGGVSK